MAGGRAGGHGAWRADTGRAGGAGDVEALVATGRRPAAFREQRVEVGGIEMVGAWAAAPTVHTGDRVWELEVAVEAEPPHRVRRFQPRPAPVDAIAWAEVADRLRACEEARSELPEPVARRLHARLPLRVGDYRVVHTVEDSEPAVWVPALGNRRDVHRQVP
jgi:hypothetical protein